MAERTDLSGLTLQLDHKYRVGAPVHRGPMATLYSGTWDLFDAPVHVRSYESLVKLRLRLRDRSRVQGAVESEAGRYRGPHLPDIIDAGMEDSSRPFLVMRLPEGDLLINRLNSAGRMTADQVVEIVRAVARALNAYRKAGATHRGPTADRVWIGDDGSVVLLGIGEVLYRDDTVSMSGAPSSELLWHIPPESFTGSLRSSSGGEPESTTMRLRTRPQGTLQGRTLEDDPRAEVYTLGCLAYHALNGHHPFFTSPDDPTEGIHATIRDTPLELREFGPDSEVWRVVSQAIARDPGERFETPTEFAEALSDAVAVDAPASDSEADTGTGPVAGATDAIAAERGTAVTTETPGSVDTFQLWAWRFSALALAVVAVVLLLQHRFESQTLLITSDPPGIVLGEEVGHVDEELGPTPVLLFGRNVASPLRIFAIGPDGVRGETGSYDVGRFQDLGRCRATELHLEYPEESAAGADDGSGAGAEAEPNE